MIKDSKSQELSFATDIFKLSEGSSLQGAKGENTSLLSSGILPKIPSLTDIVLNFDVPRLKDARWYFTPLVQDDISLLLLSFKNWRDYAEYLLLRVKNNESLKIEYIGVKCSKRGNDVFARRLDSRLGFLKTDEKFFNPEDFERHSNFRVKTRLLWTTLTYDSDRCSLDEAWANVGSEFNLWITNLRNRYGKIYCVSFLQAFPDSEGEAYGYPHYHVIMLFDDVEFTVFRHWGKNSEGIFELAYRIEEKYELESQGNWHSHIDVKALSSMKAVWNYAKKHCYNAGYGTSDEASLNNAIMWLHRKRSFNMSGEFRKKYTEFIDVMHNSKTFQARLVGNPFPLFEYTFCGVYSCSKLGISEEFGLWRYEIDAKRGDSLYDEFLNRGFER